MSANYTMEIPANFNRFVTDTLSAYRTNGSRMLVAIFYASVDQIGNHRNTTKLQQIVTATTGNADQSIVRSLVAKLVSGVTFTEEGKVKLAKEVKVNSDEAQIVLDAMNKATTFRSEALLKSLGLRVSKVTPFDLTKSTENYVKNVLKEGVPVEVALQALKNAFDKAITKDQQDGTVGERRSIANLAEIPH